MAKDRSTFLGPRLRRLRRELGLTQAVMAEDLDISPSYIALIERNHRPLSADLLIRLAEIYDVDIAAFAGAEDETMAQLEAALADPIFTDLSVTRDDLHDLTAANPALGEAVAALYQRYRASERAVMETRAGTGSPAKDPVEDARDFIGRKRNYFSDLDLAGEETGRALAASKRSPLAAIADRLETRHNLKLRILPADVMVGAYRRLDRHRAQVAISEALDQASRLFQAALQLALLEMSDMIDAAAPASELETEAGHRLARAALANYAAGAIMLPYEHFYQSVLDLNHDIETLSRRYGASFEQIAHRLTTLQRPGREGIPFFFIRIDAAGNISKRYSAGVFPFARYGGSCPLWNIHETFRAPGRLVTQVVQLPDSERYFSIARTVRAGAGGFHAPRAERAVALGCELKHAARLVYAEGLDLDRIAPTPIGVTCRLCPRQACAARAHPPLERRLIIDEHRRMAAPFSFAFD